MADDQERPDTHWNDGLSRCPGSQPMEDTNGTPESDTRGAKGTSNSSSTERNLWDVEDDMFMIQSYRSQDTQESPRGMSFISSFDRQSFAALRAPATTNIASGTASAQADRTLRDTGRSYEHPRPQSDPNRVRQPTSAQDSRQQSLTPAENAWGFVRSPELQTPVNTSSGLTGEPQAPRTRAGRSTTGSNGESQQPPPESARSTPHPQTFDFMEPLDRESLERLGFLESGSAERHQHLSDPDVTTEPLYHEQDDTSMIQPCEQEQAHATTGGVGFMLPFNFESYQNSNIPASTSSGSDIDAAQIGHALADSNRE